MGGRAEEREEIGSRSNGAWARLKDKLSFVATLVSVAAVAIFIGWLLGQYAIQAVTGPRLTDEPLLRPTVADGAAGATASGVTGTTASSTAGTTTSSTTGSAAGATTSGSGSPAAAGGGFWRVQAGAFSERARADGVVSDLHARGFEAAVVLGAQPVPYRVQVGAFREEARARAIVEELRAAGFEAAVFAPN